MGVLRLHLHSVPLKSYSDNHLSSTYFPTCLPVLNSLPCPSARDWVESREQAVSASCLLKPWVPASAPLYTPQPILSRLWLFLHIGADLHPPTPTPPHTQWFPPCFGPACLCTLSLLPIAISSPFSNTMLPRHSSLLPKNLSSVPTGSCLCLSAFLLSSYHPEHSFFPVFM